MKIKRKVEMNLPQLIEWLLKSGYRNYTANSNMGNIVTLSRYGAIQFSHGIFFPEETFTVEVEEEVNGETILDRLYEVYFDGLKHDTNMFTNTTTNSLITSKTALIYTVIDNQVIVLWEKYTGGFR